MPSAEPRYYNAHDARMRLDRSILLYKEKPVWVRVPEQSDKMEILLFSIPENKPVAKVDPNSLDLDISSLALGYAQGGENCYYVCRIPYRRQKQGISPDNMLGSYPMAGDNTFSISEGHIFTKGFLDMLLGEYPFFDNVLKNIVVAEGKRTVSAAFSRDFALLRPKNKNNISLFMNNNYIGEVNKERNGIILKPPNDNSLIILRLAELGVRITYD